eukprot:gene27185-4787_t
MVWDGWDRVLFIRSQLRAVVRDWRAAGSPLCGGILAPYRIDSVAIPIAHRQELLPELMALFAEMCNAVGRPRRFPCWESGERGAAGGVRASAAHQEAGHIAVLRYAEEMSPYFIDAYRKLGPDEPLRLQFTSSGLDAKSLPATHWQRINQLLFAANAKEHGQPKHTRLVFPKLEGRGRAALHWKEPYPGGKFQRGMVWEELVLVSAAERQEYVAHAERLRAEFAEWKGVKGARGYNQRSKGNRHQAGQLPPPLGPEPPRTT